MKVNWTPQELADLCRKECFVWNFWKSLGFAIYWTMFIIGILFVSNYFLRWVFRYHELFTFFILTVPVITVVSFFAGWYHSSPKIRKMICFVSGLIYLIAIPFALLILIMAAGFGSIRP